MSFPKNIVIVGGSLSGLLAGIVLQRRRHNVTILERTPASQLVDQGAGIAIAPIIPTIVAALKQLGSSVAPLIEFFTQYDRTAVPTHVPGNGFLYLKPDGTVRQEVELPIMLGSSSWNLLYNILRANFDGKYELSYVSAPCRREGDGEANYKSGVRVTGLEDLDQTVKVEYEGSEGQKLVTEVDFVIGADGPGSAIRTLLLPGTGRKYAGYMAFRGTVKESLLTAETRKLFEDKAVFFMTKGMQILAYNIPGFQGTLERSERISNLVWYCNATEEEREQLLTDADGVEHSYSLGLGKIQPSVRASQRALAEAALPPCFAEAWCKVESPFIQAITDSICQKAVFMEGKVFLIGDALAGHRPHTTAGTTQGAFHALLLGEVFDKVRSVTEWEKAVLEFATLVQDLGVSMGNLSQFGDHPMALTGEDDAVVRERGVGTGNRPVVSPSDL